MISRNVITTDKQILHNYLKLFSGEFFSKILGYITLLVIVKYVDVNTFGKYSILLVLIGLSSLFIEFGLDSASIYFLAKYNNIRRTVQTNLVIRSILFITSLIPFYFLLIFFFDKNVNLVLFGIIALSNLSSVFSYDYIFRYYGKMQVVAKINIYSSLIFLIAIFPVLAIVNSISGVIICFSATKVARTILSIYYYYKYKKSSEEALLENYFEIFGIVKYATPIFISSVLIWIYYQSDTLILEYFHGKKMVAYYSAAYKFILLFAAIQMLYNQSIFPTLSRISETSYASVKEFVEKYFNIFFYFTTPIFFIVMLFSRWIIITLYGTQYSETIFIFNLLLFSIVFVFNESVTAPLMLASGKSKIHMLIVGVGAFVNVFLNFCLVPGMGMKGAAFSTIIAEAVIFSLFAYYAHKYFNLKVIFFLKVFVVQLLLLIFFAFKYELL